MAKIKVHFQYKDHLDDPDGLPDHVGWLTADGEITLDEKKAGSFYEFLAEDFIKNTHDNFHIYEVVYG